ncbi:hypothetical protein B0H17DRAFT_332324 [Mycena rosella]|uniref:Uncharacterized protein n=1 Tax=Mycena rosella TaxID=1033263 RepID=A0AAD7GMT0_MYCRO|nr:hypothetical protein B0H17DRAFT_332324 [Mycena rosella]
MGIVHKWGTAPWERGMRDVRLKTEPKEVEMRVQEKEVEVEADKEPEQPKDVEKDGEGDAEMPLAGASKRVTATCPRTRLCLARRPPAHLWLDPVSYFGLFFSSLGYRVRRRTYGRKPASCPDATETRILQRCIHPRCWARRCRLQRLRWISAPRNVVIPL